MLLTVPDIIDGRQWARERLRHLQAMLDAAPSDGERQQIEAEMQALRAQKSQRGFRWWPRSPHRTD